MCGCSSLATICASRSKRRTKSGWFASSGRDRLDRDLASDLRLGGAIDDAERALADLLEEPVAAQRLALEIERGVLAKDPLVEQSGDRERDRCRARRASTVRARSNAARASACRSERYRASISPPHRRSRSGWACVRPSSSRDDLDVAAEVEAAVDLLLERLQAELLEPRDLPRQGGLGRSGRRGRGPRQSSSASARIASVTRGSEPFPRAARSRSSNRRASTSSRSARRT